MIYHLTSPIEWQMAQQAGHYSAPSLDSEGFIHCSSKEQVVTVANTFYSHTAELVLLCIEEDKLDAVLKWEAPAHPDGTPVDESDTQPFPHVYGIINLESVVAFWQMPKEGDAYQLPAEI
ncbi:MAG: DUF952 domain-containing protein [Chloroflexota bacterium]